MTGNPRLIGRLLYETKSIYEDQYAAVETTSKRKGLDEVDLALLLDGLSAEREQGITIDVAYRYFETPARKFIIADTPGHIQYTRNMVTGASTADSGRHPDRCPKRHPDPVQTAWLHCFPSADPPLDRCRQQDGSGGLFRRGL